MINRRIGRNEIAAIRVALAYHDAQKLYFDMAGQSGTAQYAQRLVSRPDQHDGLYWPAEDGEEQSPLAPLVHRRSTRAIRARSSRASRFPTRAITSAS